MKMIFKGMLWSLLLISSSASLSSCFGFGDEAMEISSITTVTLENGDIQVIITYVDEDIKPTSTTLQFGDGEVEKVYSDMQRQKEAQKASFSLNGKGKLVVVLYSLAVTVILALIILNTGVLATIKSGNQAKASILSDKVAEYQVVSQRIDAISSNDYVIDIAKNDYGMIKGN